MQALQLDIHMVAAGSRFSLTSNVVFANVKHQSNILKQASELMYVTCRSDYSGAQVGSQHSGSWQQIQLQFKCCLCQREVPDRSFSNKHLN